jgi:hypothetical protein
VCPAGLAHIRATDGWLLMATPAFSIMIPAMAVIVMAGMAFSMMVTIYARIDKFSSQIFLHCFICISCCSGA